MAAFTYTASARAPLVATSPAHVAGLSYSVDIKLQGFTEGIDQPKTQHVSIDGSVETVLRRATRTMSISIIWPDSLNANVEEFLFSIAGGETFTFDPFGTVAVPDDPITVVMIGGVANIARMSHGSAPWRQVSMQLRPAT